MTVEASPESAAVEGRNPRALRQGTSIRLSGIRKSYGKSGFEVHIPELVIEAGEFLSLVGASGCGKSTTLRVIAGLEYPTEGDVWFGDRRMTDVPVQRRNLAMVFQDYALYPSLRVRGNLEYGLRKHGVPKPVREEKVREISRLLGLEAYLDRRPRELSGGQQQRVALGRAIIRSPDVLLMDEPLSNLDAVLRTGLRSEIRRLQQQMGYTTVYVTHDQLEAMTMSDRMAVMRDGRIEQIGTPDSVFNHPANMYVAKMIGSPAMNMIPGQLKRGPDGLEFRSDVGRIRLSEQRARRLGHPDFEGDAILGVRAQHLKFSGNGDALRLRVSLVQLVGTERHIELEGPRVTVSARVDAAQRATAGDVVDCFIPDEECMHFFDPATGRRIGT